MFKRQKYSETIFLPKKIKQRGVVYRDKFKKIVKVIAEFDKFKKIFFVTDYGPKAAVIININGKILLSRQYRLLLNNISYEIPAGSINKNEKPNKAAIRECLEETGYFCKKLIALHSLIKSFCQMFLNLINFDHFEFQDRLLNLLRVF